MTISSTVNKSGPYSGNGSTTVFARTFRVLDADHLSVYETTDGVTTKVTTGITKDGIGADTGNVTFDVAPATGTQITLIREVPMTQETDYSSQGKVAPVQVEDDLDDLQMQIQDLAEKIGRAILAPILSSGVSDLPFSANRVIGFNSSADGFAVAGSTRAELDAAVSFLNGLSGAGDASDAVNALYTPGWTGAVSRSVTARLKEVVFAADFGVIADGVTDDASAIQAAIDYVSSAGGGFVVLPPGTMMVSVAINPKTGVSLHGSKGVTEIKSSTGMTGTFYSNSSVKDFSVYGVVFNANLNASTSAVQFNEDGYENIHFVECEFKNSDTAWTVLIGYVQGSAGSPGDVNSAGSTRSQNISFKRCVFGRHQNSTLEQLIIVNTWDCDIQDCVFEENQTDANSILVYAFSRGVRISGNEFRDIQDVGVGVQESDHVWITNNRMQAEATMNGRFVNLINCADVWVNQNAVLATKSQNPTFVAAYAWKGSTFESGNYTAQYQGVYRVDIRGNKTDGCYSLAQIPQQKQSDKTFVFEDICIEGNSGRNFGGAPIILGNYTVSDAATQTESLANISVVNNTFLSWDGFDEGWLYALGTSTQRISGLVVTGNSASSPASGTNGYGIRCNYVSDFIIANNNTPGKGGRQAIKTENEVNGVIHGNHTHGFGVSFGDSASVDVRGNFGCTAMQERHLVRAQNKHGSTIAGGSPVIMSSFAEGYMVTMTNGAGDRRVMGVMLANTSNDDFGYVIVHGPVYSLRVDGTDDIAIGDSLSTFTTEGIAQKAATSEFAFAQALEAYTSDDSNGSINAFVHTVRQAA